VKTYLKYCVAAVLGGSVLAPAGLSADEVDLWAKAYNNETKERFIPVELFTGAKWDGKHELVMKEAATSTCVSVNGRQCGNFYISGPFKTETNDTEIKWVGEQIPYYIRTFDNRYTGPVVSHFTINASRDGLVRIYDKRKQWGERLYTGAGIKFPLGNWKQGEVRTYISPRPIRLEILELNGPDNCLTFRWTIGDGKRRNSDNNYTFCPNVGFKKMDQNYQRSRREK
jgi:hypothetical protein